MPEMPSYVKGIINLRGKIIPVMDVRLRFGKKERQYDDRTCIIVINYRESFTGLIVDSVSEVLTIPEAGIVELTQDHYMNTNGLVKRVGKIDNSVILMVNCNMLIFDEALQERDYSEIGGSAVL
jgi:purine-binding chemotaxis protein CheW